MIYSDRTPIGPNWYFVVFALNGIISGALFVSGILMVLEMCDAGRRPTYTGIANTAVGIVGVVAPLLGTSLAEVDYRLLFAASALAYFTAFGLFKWWVREPRASPPDPLS
ncbi:MAG: Major Facilitator Superfamily protein [Chloroflexi bacterium ADurb.Bin360]|nr:MAG: Major Facilitator Superfamily protein [Chloroflexi bacterium ADurb.Bin360]